MTGAYGVGVCAALQTANPIIRHIFFQSPLPKITAISAYRAFSTQSPPRATCRIPIQQRPRIPPRRSYYHSTHSTRKLTPKPPTPLDEYESLLKLQTKIKDAVKEAERKRLTAGNFRKVTKAEALSASGEAEANLIRVRNPRSSSLVEDVCISMAVKDLKKQLQKPLEIAFNAEVGEWIVQNLRDDVNVEELKKYTKKAAELGDYGPPSLCF